MRDQRKLSVAIRVDAGPQIGTGHLMRTLTLADALRQKGARVRFVSRDLPFHLRQLLEGKGHEFAALPVVPPTKAAGDLAHSHWLSVTQERDAEETNEALSDTSWEWLMVDHYALDSRWERALRGRVHRILAIDDLADRIHDSDILLDQNLVAQMETRYDGKVSASCVVLAGPEYALLHPVYAELRNRVPARIGPIHRILVFFGGADLANFTGRALAAILAMERREIEVDVVVCSGNPHVAAVHQQAAGHANIHLHGQLPTLAPLMARADLAIGAGGATSWERLCLGLPALVVTLAENQRPIAEELARRGLVRWLGDAESVDASTIRQELALLLRDDFDGTWSMQARALVDGRGVKRLCASLLTTAESTLCVRHASLDDEALVLRWANAPVTRRNSFSSVPISEAVHRAWFLQRMRRPDTCYFYIVDTLDGVALGQVRFECIGACWEVHYLLAPVFHGRRLGRPLLQAALSQFKADSGNAVVVGRVKAENVASLKIFEALNFVRTSIAEERVVSFQRTL